MTGTPSGSDFQIVPPDAPSLLRAMRSTGYDFESAIADLIDNSISAGAHRVDIIMCEQAEESWIAIVDDGVGMDEESLVRAMTVGGIDPDAARDEKDLGRFGLGLKTASLSQCRRLTVFTRDSKGSLHARCWDLDFVAATGQWALRTGGFTAALESRFRQHLTSLGTGTVVVWECLDRIVPDERVSEIGERLRGRIPSLEKHLSMVFHRFLEEKDLEIWVGDVAVQAWDPFMRTHVATQRLSAENLWYQGTCVYVHPYVLPHVSKLNSVEHASGSGPRKWNDHQGFYIYRNRRLLVGGSWLNLGLTKEEHNKLARIQVDFPNSLDFAWDINIRKSRAAAPDALRKDLLRIANRTREEARRIYRHRGAVIARQNTESIYLWEQITVHGSIFYRLNRSHPVMLALAAAAKEAGIAKQVNACLHLIQDTIPVPLILIDGSESPEKLEEPARNCSVEQITAALRMAYACLCKNGVPSSEALTKLSRVEPFCHYPEVLASFDERIGS